MNAGVFRRSLVSGGVLAMHLQGRGMVVSYLRSSGGGKEALAGGCIPRDSAGDFAVDSSLVQGAGMAAVAWPQLLALGMPPLSPTFPPPVSDWRRERTALREVLGLG